MTANKDKQRAITISVCISVFLHLLVLSAMFAFGRDSGTGLSSDTLSVNLQEQTLESEIPRQKEERQPKVVVPEHVPIETRTQPKIQELPQQIDQVLDLPNTDTGFDSADFSISFDAGAFDTSPIDVSTDMDSHLVAEGDGRAEDLEMQHFQEVAKHIKDHLTYPQTAREHGIEGKVNVSMTLHANGSVSNVKMTKSSGFESLDDEALVIVERATPLPKFGFKLIQSKGTKLNFDMVLNFTLKDM